MHKIVYLTLTICISCAFGDLYLQNPRGSNDRLNEANENRDNANRLMDTQNNAKGGYCYGPSMYFYEHSMLSIEWTNQHGCNNQNMQCNLVVQYMCGQTSDPPESQIRDGTTTNTITPNSEGANAKDGNGNLLYGLHEPLASYTACATRERNKGLFVADRVTLGDLNGNTALFTRQNNNGDQYGLECTEERDYYPYWHPSPWKDVAVLTDDTSLCSFFQSESQNVKSKNYCASSSGTPNQYNNEADCTANGGTWTSASSYGIAAPDCVQAPWTRDNHLGNSDTGYTASYNWTLPTSDQESCIGAGNCACVLRLRYNISTNDIQGYGSTFSDSSSSGYASPVQDDPNVSVQDTNLTLAMDTTQFGRTFQDRSYVFSIKSRPSGVSSNARIYNLNVRGKRGNIVQTYPATEYDFVPNVLYARQNDYIHFQWTGCDTNPAGNAGEGTDQTDRSNIVQIANVGDNYPATQDWISSHTALFEDTGLRKQFAFINQPIDDTTKCLTYAALLTKDNNNQNTVDQDSQNCMKLNYGAEAGATPKGFDGRYFDGGLVKMNLTGNFYFMSSRNNNFSNRSQKGTIIVYPLLPSWAVALLVIGSALFVASAGVAGATLYSRSHPHSRVATILNRVSSRI